MVWLIYLDLRFNNFHGPLPAEVYTKLSQIKDLILNNNAFTGTITDSIGAFPGEVLSLANNKFTGPIPSTLAKATGLNEFVVLGNQLTGSIPTGLGALKKLKVFDVSQNRLTGTVPEDLCSIKTLEHLILSGNKLDKHLGPMCAALKKKGILKI
ncbi:leucine-rich repeat-containing 40 [Pyrenophora seminiperda CCB06]|uniref:Leucine-rich repeat-containing 40 n=1 Tax=Pyrenophora seminiperda CCB06 TaxID=1302712 RepID=A0A3M7M1Q9_9PLEO|nr:leucine-rich repeat-containing 40 [Pyrenophora seminiperda CCB06]